MNSSLNLKQRVKEGKITPQEALKEMGENAHNPEQALSSRTADWLRSSNAQRRYEQARKAKKSI